MTDTRIVRLRGKDIAYRDFPGDGTPLLLVHGMGSSLHTWGAIPEALAATGSRVITVDLPGHGSSDLDHDDFGLETHALALRDLLDELDIPQVHLVGHSLGGGVSLQFIDLFPERADNLILVSSGGLGEEAFPGLRLASLPGAGLAIGLVINRSTMRSAAWLGRTLRSWGLDLHALTPGALDTVSHLEDRSRRRAFLRTLRSVIGLRGQTVSAVYALPSLQHRRVLIIWGERDPILPVHHGVSAHALIPDSRLVIFPDARHEPHVEDPERFTQALVRHLLLAEQVAPLG